MLSRLLFVALGLVLIPAAASAQAPPCVAYPFAAGCALTSSALNAAIASRLANDASNQAATAAPNLGGVRAATAPPVGTNGLASYGQLWLDTSVSPAVLRECWTAAGCSATYVAGQWSSIAPVGSGTANQVFATPNGSSGAGSFRALVGADLGSAPGNQVIASPSNGSTGTGGYRALVGADLPDPSSTTLGGIKSGTAASGQYVTGVTTGGALSFGYNAVIDAREFGLYFDNTLHAGSAAALQAAVDATAGSVALWFPISSGCLILDGQVLLPNGTTILGPGIHSGACVKPEANITIPDMFDTGIATSNITLAGFEVDGNNANEVAQTWKCLETGYITNLNIDLYVHNCPNDAAYTAGHYVKIRGDYFDNGSRDVVTGGGNTPTDDLDVNVSVGGSVNGAYSCVGICTHFTVTVRCKNADTGGLGSDCATGYNAANAHGQWRVDCDTSQNHCMHVGGSDQHVTLTGTGAKFSGLYLSSTEFDTAGTVTTDGSSAIVGSGTNFTKCPHNCQNATGIIYPTMVINNVDYTIDHCTDATHCVATTTIPAASGASYQLIYTTYTTNITATVNQDGTGSGAQACVNMILVSNSHINGDCTGSPSGALVTAGSNDEINIETKAATNNGVGSNGYGYTTGTVTATNGSPNVVGVGTAWLSNLAAGDIIRIASDTATYAVQSVTDDTHLVLVGNYGGSAPGGSAYRAAWPSTYLRIGGESLNATNSGASLTDTIGSDINMTANNNGAYGYTEGGVSGYSFPNCYHGQAAGNVTAAYALNTGSLHGNCLP